MEAIAQMNVRLGRDLKAAGDAVLAEAGITPTELVRELWEKVSHGVADVMQVREVLQGRLPSDSGTVEFPESSELIEALEHGRTLFAAGLDELGVRGSCLDWGDGSLDADTYAEALMDRMRERGTW